MANIVMQIQKLKCKYLIPGDKYNRISVPLIQSPLAQAKQSRPLLGIIRMFSAGDISSELYGD